jgi:16S rRNA (cytidine1402-2'-O)-methyltransferase
VSGVLRVVGTPIGHLEDLSPRAVATLRTSALVACEDTRVTRAILQRHGIAVPVVSCHRFNEHSRSERILQVLESGADVALVTDSGTPGVSDPGAAVVRAARAAGFAVSPVPGPAAVAALWSVSGLEGPFTFIGFLPQRHGERRRALAALAGEPRPLVFYESPHRILAMLEDAAEVLGDRRALVGRELTKIHEEVIAATLGGLRERLAGRTVRGEFTLIVEPAPDAERSRRVSPDATAEETGAGGPAAAAADLDAAADEVTRLIHQGIERGTALKRVARDRGVPRRALYDLMVRRKAPGKDS